MANDWHDQCTHVSNDYHELQEHAEAGYLSRWKIVELGNGAYGLFIGQACNLVPDDARVIVELED